MKNTEGIEVNSNEFISEFLLSDLHLATSMINDEEAKKI